MRLHLQSSSQLVSVAVVALVLPMEQTALRPALGRLQQQQAVVVAVAETLLSDRLEHLAGAVAPTQAASSRAVVAVGLAAPDYLDQPQAGPTAALAHLVELAAHLVPRMELMEVTGGLA